MLSPDESLRSPTCDILGLVGSHNSVTSPRSEAKVNSFVLTSFTVESAPHLAASTSTSPVCAATFNDCMCSFSPSIPPFSDQYLKNENGAVLAYSCLLYTSPSPRD